jgi:hypothetical protein
MSKSTELCPKCGQRFPEGITDPGRCPGCGELCSSQQVVDPQSWPEAPGPDEVQTRGERRRWRLCFWLCFLLTPAAVLLAALLMSLFRNAVPGSAGQFQRWLAPFGVFPILALGTLGAGFSLAKLHAKPRTTAGLVGVTVAFAVGLTVVYVGILFVGCLVIVKQFKLFQF